MDRIEVERIANDYSVLVRESMPIQKIVLFGSQLNGNAGVDSDIDIAVVVRGITGDYLSIVNQLYRLRSKVNLYIEPILLDELKDKSGFLAEVLKTGKVIYNSSSPNV